MEDQELVGLERRAADLGVEMADRAEWGARWKSVLARRIEDTIWSREKLEIVRRRRESDRGAA